MAQGQAELVPAAGSAKGQQLQSAMAGNIKSPQEWMQRRAVMREHAFLLTPTDNFSAIAPGYEISPQLVDIDPSVDAESGRGADVYYQKAIHKSRKVDRQGGGYDYVPLEVSINAQGLLRILAAAGVNVHDTIWSQDGSKERYLWVAETAGDIIEFTGQVRKLPAGIGSLDARDGSADIGEWTPEEWAKRVAVANQQREKTPKSDQWKIKPESINGWTGERVMQVRKYGRQLAKTKSLSGLCRRLGVKQSYTIEELKRKPFVVIRAVFMPDMTNPEIAKMVTAANLGARFSIYPGAALPPGEQAALTHAPGEHGMTLPGDVVDATVESPERMQTAAPPQGLEELVEQPAKAEEQKAPPVAPLFTVLKVLRKGKPGTPEVQYFVETKEGITLFTTDENLLPGLQAAAKDNQPREIATERVVVAEQPYRQIIEITAPGGVKY